MIFRVNISIFAFFIAPVNNLYQLKSIFSHQGYYPFYTLDCFIEISEEVIEMFKEFDCKEAAYRLCT
ncbi:hypothetical protein DW865_11275 [Mediterraneibacter gnavus]|nr:hypothetical protein DW865_11275 [Mediterraneibacter gnavus]